MGKLITLWGIAALIGIIVGCIDIWIFPIEQVTAGWFFSPLILGLIFGWGVSVLFPDFQYESESLWEDH